MSNRSGTPYSAPTDADRRPVLLGVSTADGITPLPLEVDPNTGQLQTSSSGGGGGSTQYTDGGVPPAHPIGNAIEWSDGSNWQTVSTAKPLPVTASISTAGLATSVKQSDGSQKTQIVDGGGNVIGATSNALDINIKSGNPTSITANAGTNLNTSLLALESGGNLAAIKADVDKIPSLGQALAAASVPVVLTAAQITTLTPPTNTGYALDSSLTTIDTDLKSNITLHAGANLIGKVGIDQTTPGTTNAVFASNFPTTVDTNSGNKSASTLRVVLATDQPQLTNKLLVTPDSVALPANQSVNVSQINAVTPLMGNGVTGTGSQRVTIASDNTAFSVNSTLSAETTKVIGVVRTADGSGNLLTATSNALDVNIKTSAASNISTNIAQLAGNTISSGVGTSGTGTLRVVEANDVGRTLKSAGGSASSSGNNTLVAAGTNKLKVYAFSLTTTSTSSTTCIFQSGASGTELWRVVLQAPTGVNVGANLAVTVPGYLFSTASATLLNLNLSGANTVHWSVAYFDEA